MERDDEEFDGGAPAKKWDAEAAKRTLDDLFVSAGRYRSSSEYRKLLDFVVRFRVYAPFNAMLIHSQMPGARYVAPAHRWVHDYGRSIRPNARPIVILQPMGPVMFVFDVSDTEPRAGADTLPPGIEKPFEARGRTAAGPLARIQKNALRDGIRISEQQAGSQSAGSIGPAAGAGRVFFQTRRLPHPAHLEVPLRYEMLINSKHSPETQFATTVHELGHLYCGHLGAPSDVIAGFEDTWWPDRRGLSLAEREFEAESVCYLVCERLGITNPSANYLSGYLASHDEVPAISLECVLKAAGLIEQMSKGWMKPRKAGRLRPAQVVRPPKSTAAEARAPAL